MTVWVARAGKNGERENLALENNKAFIGWDELINLKALKSREEIEAALVEKSPDQKAGTLKSHSSQIYNFVHSMKIGDLFALPLKTRPAIAFGEIASDYEYIPSNPEGAKHSRSIKWLGEPIPRSKFDQDLLYSFGSAMTVFTVHRNDAENRVRNILAGRISSPKVGQVAATQADDNVELDMESIAKQQIDDFIGRKYSGHAMEFLVAEILKAQGFVVRRNVRKGADGGADILAAKGYMGFEEPRLCVQVKTSDSAIGSKDYDELKGVMQKFNAKHGLLVSWGGFKSTVEEESKRDFFNIRLWTGADLVEELQAVYEKLPEEIRLEIPLQRTWVLVDK